MSADIATAVGILRTKGARRAVVRASWTIADQGVSSLTNFALGIVVARTFGAEDLGAFSLVFTTYLVALTIGRTLTSEPFLIRHTDADASIWRRATAHMSGVALLFGIVAGAACALAGVLLGGSFGAAYIALAVTLPGLLVQDAWRFAFIALGHARDALVNDLVWAIALVPVFVVLVGSSAPSMSDLVLTWGVAGSVAALVGVVQARVWPRPRGMRSWLAEQGDLVRPFAIRQIIFTLASQLTSYGIAIVAGLAATGALRAAQILMGPMVFFMQAMQIVAVPEGRRVLARRPSILGKASLAYAVSVGIVILGWGLFVMMLPRDVGVAILGDNWDGARAIMLAVTFSTVATWPVAAGASGLRVLEQGRRLLLAGIVNSVACLGGAVGGAAVAGALGGAIGNGIGGVVGSAATWWHLRAALRGARR